MSPSDDLPFVESLKAYPAQHRRRALGGWTLCQLRILVELELWSPTVQSVMECSCCSKQIVYDSPDEFAVQRYRISID